MTEEQEAVTRLYARLEDIVALIEMIAVSQGKLLDRVLRLEEHEKITTQENSQDR